MQKINHRQGGMALVQALGAILLLSIIAAALLNTQSQTIKSFQWISQTESSKDFVDICVKAATEAIINSTPLPQDQVTLVSKINLAISALPFQLKGLSTLANLQMKSSSVCTYQPYVPFGPVNSSPSYYRITAIQDDGVNRVHYEVVIKAPL